MEIILNERAVFGLGIKKVKGIPLTAKSQTDKSVFPSLWFCKYKHNIL